MSNRYCAVDVSKNNCHACIHLEWVDGDIGTPSGYCCNGREYSSVLVEIKHLRKLESQIYRARTKKCCERKDGK
jgi:hypothetical protein